MFFRGRWRVVRSVWPYDSGFGTYTSGGLIGPKTILDTGLSYDEAKEAAEELNAAYFEK